MNTGKRIKDLRIKRGMTQEELAEKTELSARTIQRIENGEVDPRAYTLQMIAKVLEVDFNLFLENEKGEKPEYKTFDNKNWSALMHFSGIIPLIVPTLLLWNSKKEKNKDLLFHFRAAISMQLCFWCIALVGVWILWKANQPVPLIAGLLTSSLVAVMNSIFVLMGKPCINPFLKNSEQIKTK